MSEYCHNYYRPGVVILLDIRVAYNSLDNRILWDCLLKNCLSEKFVNILKLQIQIRQWGQGNVTTSLLCHIISGVN